MIQTDTPLSTRTALARTGRTAELHARSPGLLIRGPRLSSEALALFTRLLARTSTSDRDRATARELMASVLHFRGREAPLVTVIGPDGVMLSLLAREAAARHRDLLLTAASHRPSSKYARALLSWIVSQGTPGGSIEPTLRQMRSILSVERGRLRTSSHLWQRAIKPACEELAALGWYVHAVDVRDRKVTAYCLTWASIGGGLR